MKKIVVYSILFVSLCLNMTESLANTKVKSQKSNIFWGCGEWKPIMSGSTQVGEYRECTNIFGNKRLEIVHFH